MRDRVGTGRDVASLRLKNGQDHLARKFLRARRSTHWPPFSPSPSPPFLFNPHGLLRALQHTLARGGRATSTETEANFNDCWGNRFQPRLSPSGSGPSPHLRATRKSLSLGLSTLGDGSPVPLMDLKAATVLLNWHRSRTYLAIFFKWGKVCLYSVF